MSSVEHGSSEIINTHAEGSINFMGPKVGLGLRALLCRGEASATAAELRQLPLEEIKSRCPEEVEDARMYVPFANIGLPLQPRFRTVRTIKRSEDAAGEVQSYASQVVEEVNSNRHICLLSELSDSVSLNKINCKLNIPINKSYNIIMTRCLNLKLKPNL